jgi:ATP-binding protein involved in chromosome partitioning
MAIREGGDNGTPIAVSDPDGAHAQAYRAIAENIWAKVGDRVSQPEAPNIVFE